MAERVIPESCNQKVYKNGVSVAQIAQGGGCRSWHIEDFIKEIAKKTKTATDWHCSAGIAQVLTLGDPQKVAAAIKKKWPEFHKKWPQSQVAFGLPARYRAGVDELPDGVIVVS